MKVKIIRDNEANFVIKYYDFFGWHSFVKLEYIKDNGERVYQRIIFKTEAEVIEVLKIIDTFNVQYQPSNKYRWITCIILLVISVLILNLLLLK